jgi:hypothetical protein
MPFGQPRASAKMRAEVNMDKIVGAALIAFSGVVIGLIGNGLLQQWDRRSKQDHERQVVRSALLAELSFLLKSYKDRTEMMERTPAHFDVPRASETEVYDRLFDKIGVLKPEQGKKVIHAYLAAKHLSMDINWIIREVHEFLDGKLEPGPHEGMIRVPKEYIGAVVAMHRERIELFKDAIAALKDR